MIVQKLALHENGVEFRQQFNGAIRTSLTASYDDVRREATLPRDTGTREPTVTDKTENIYSNVALAKNVFALKCHTDPYFSI